MRLNAARSRAAGGGGEGLAPGVFELVTQLLGNRPPLRLKTWDGGVAGPPDAPVTVELAGPRALRRLLWQPNELGLARAFVSGDIQVEGDLVTALSASPRPQVSPARHDRDPRLRLGRAGWLTAAQVAKRAGALGPPVPPPPGEVRLHGVRHSRHRDAAAIAHHYDVGNDFYRLLLDESMTYSCAYWKSDPSPAYTLGDAQADKYALISRKLGLRPGMRLLDVGCGWGGMVLHAARLGVRAVGITLSQEQATLARQRVTQAGFDELVEVRLCDYRDVGDGPFDAISSIGMAEHVGAVAYADYAGRLHSLLADGGRLLNHQISKPDGPSRRHGPSFIDRYIFPDGELLPVGRVAGVLERAGFEVRDVESLRENYTLTLRQWLENLRGRRDRAVELVGEARTRTWELYLAGSAAAFDAARIGIHQTLAVKTAGGRSGLPRIRSQWLCAEHI